jgi:hypothetical protein
MAGGGYRASMGTARVLPEIIPKFSGIGYSPLQLYRKFSPSLFVTIYFSQFHPAAIGLISRTVNAE